MTTITITGMGGVINYEAYVIKEALEKAGCTVEMENNHPEPDIEEMKAEIYNRITNDDWAGPEFPSLKGKIKKEVKIVVQHLPWGG